MEEKILEKILQNTYTLESLKKRVKALKQKINIDLFGLKIDPKGEDQQETAWLKSLGPDLLEVFNKEDFHEVFEKLDRKIATLQPLVVYLAFDPGPSQIVLIGAWFRQNYHKDFIFDIKIDPGLIAGCAFVLKGIYKDYSIRARLSANKEVITTSFKNYLKTK